MPEHDADVARLPLPAEAPGGPVDVSVCIANWNCRDLLRGCLASLTAQGPDVSAEVIVVDNASTDGAADMVAQEFPRVALHRNAVNLGFARANNQAARLARGRFLFFLNNDTLVPAGALSRLVVYARAHPEVGMIGPRLRDGAGQVQVSYRLLPTVAVFLNRLRLVQWTRLLRGAYRRYRRERFDPDTTRQVEFLMGAAVLMPREVFEACGGWDERYEFGGEDLDLCLRVGRTRPIIYYPEVELTHFGRSSTRQRIGPATSQIERGFVRYLRQSGSGPWALRFYKLMVCLSAPVELVGRALKYVERRLRGRRAEAHRSLLLMRGLAHFLFRGLVPFWRA